MGVFHYLEILQGKGVLSQLMSLCIIPNLLLFFVFIWMNKMSSSRGVLFSMFVLGSVILTFRFIG